MTNDPKWWWRPGVKAVMFNGRKLYLSCSRAAGTRAMYESRTHAETDDPLDPFGPLAWAILYRGGRIARYHVLIGYADRDLTEVPE